MSYLPGIYLGFRHNKAVFGLETITEMSQYEVAIDPNHHGYTRAFKLKKDGTRYSKSIPLHAEGFRLFKGKLEAQTYITNYKREIDNRVQELIQYSRKNIEYLDGVQFP